MKSVSRILPFALPFLAVVPVSAQAQFQQQLGGAVVGNWIGIDPSSPTDLIVWTAEAGERIRRIKTAGGGSSSFEQLNTSGNPSAAALHRVFVREDLSLGIAVGSGGKAYWAANLDLGSIWWRFNLTGGITANLWDVFLDNSGGQDYRVIAGEQRTLISYDPGSSHWIPMGLYASPTETLDFRCLAFVDPALTPGYHHGVVGGSRYDSLTGFSFNCIYYTLDGVAWRPATVTPPANWPYSTFMVWDADFVPGSATVAYAVGGLGFGNGTGFALKSVDGGQTWSPTYPECNPNAPPTASCPTTTLQAQTPAPCTGTVGSLTVGIHNYTDFLTMYGVSALPNGDAIAASYGGGVWRYRYSTKAWQDRADTSEFSEGPMWGSDALRVGNTDHVWVSGQFGDIRRSTDGGNTFSQWVIGSGHAIDPVNQKLVDRPDIDWRLKDVSFGSDSVGYAVGQKFLIAKTRNGGAHWYAQTFDKTNSFYFKHIACGSANNAVAIGDSSAGPGVGVPSVVYDTGGGTQCWPPASLPLGNWTGKQLQDVYFVNDAGPVYWIVGDDAIFWRSTTSGQSWVVATPSGIPSTFQARAIAVDRINPANGYVVGTDGSIGQIWSLTGLSGAAPTPIAMLVATGLPKLNGVAIDGGIACAVSDGGSVFVDPGTGSFALDTQASSFTADRLFRAAVFSGSPSTLFVSGERGIVLTGTQSQVGQAVGWGRQVTRTTDNLTGMCFRNPTLGWLTGVANFALLPIGPHTPTGWGDSTIIKYQ